MSYFLCTISFSQRRNWQLAKESKVWGLPVVGLGASSLGVKSGDNLIFWLATKGYIAMAQVSSNPYTPASREEVPWAGGLSRYGILIPMNLVHECQSPIFLPFENKVQKLTGVHQGWLQRGFVELSGESGSIISDLVTNFEKN